MVSRSGRGDRNAPQSVERSAQPSSSTTPSAEPAAAELGANVRRAREALRLSQQVLAERAGFSAFQTISEIEHGRRDVKAWELVRLAGALHTSMDVLLGITPAAAAHRVLWRRGAPAHDRAREAQLLERARRYAQLEAWCGELPAQPLPDVPFDPRTATYPQVRALAEQMRRTFDLGGIPAASLLPTLEGTYGVKVFYEDLADDEDASAACVRGEDFGAAILMDASEAPWRRNFSFAHELFHLVTWSAVERAWAEHVAASASQESEPEWFERLEKLANSFASHLLLPAESVLAHLEARRQGEGAPSGTIKPTIPDLVFLAASTFKVSTAALVYRLVDLGVFTREDCEALLADAHLRALDRHMRRGAWDRPASPFSERYWELARTAYERGEVGLSLLATYLETPIGALDAALNVPPSNSRADAAEAKAPAAR
jgi:Zn-dependent peptidase ImmA (M78 family)/transcriptional regulator with XRE-family HTH domain